MEVIVNHIPIRFGGSSKNQSVVSITKVMSSAGMLEGSSENIVYLSSCAGATVRSPVQSTRREL